LYKLAKYPPYGRFKPTLLVKWTHARVWEGLYAVRGTRS